MCFFPVKGISSFKLQRSTAAEVISPQKSNDQKSTLPKANSQILVNTIKMVDFHGYVSLQECMSIQSIVLPLKCFIVPEYL